MHWVSRATKTFLISYLLIAGTQAHAELIELFESTIELNQDSSFVVTETITYNFGSANRHGMLRCIPTTHPQPARQWHQSRYLDIEVLAVMRNGNTELFAVKQESDSVCIKIGDSDSASTGTHIYEITYRVTGGLLYNPSQDAELYWNVTGLEWRVPMQRVTVTVEDRAELLIGYHSCYRGVEGEVGSCELPVVATSSVTFSTGYMLPHSGMTIALAIDPIKVEKVILEKMPLVWVWVAGFIGWFAGLFWFVYRRMNAHRIGNVIVPQYEPYKDSKPMYAGVLFDDTLDPKDITACIVYLASQGVLRIKKIEQQVLFFIKVDDYEITLQRNISSVEDIFQQSVLTILFETTAMEGSVVTLGALKKNYAKQQAHRITMQLLEQHIESDLIANGYFQKGLKLKMYSMVLAAAVLVLGIVYASAPHIVLLLVPVTVAVVLGSMFALTIAFHRVRTRKGRQARDHLIGFREFLSVTEKERYKFHNAPQKSPEQFMEYLPYAIAFGVEKEWTEVFSGSAIPNPDWYEGVRDDDFSAVALAESLGAFSTAFAASSGTSASSGGGSVGGGAGGGGGGSW